MRKGHLPKRDQRCISHHTCTHATVIHNEHTHQIHNIDHHTQHTCDTDTGQTHNTRQMHIHNLHTTDTKDTTDTQWCEQTEKQHTLIQKERILKAAKS